MQFQCDGGGEVINAAFLKHLATHGIRQLMSFPHTSQQNDLPERKHRHITELGLTMMYNSKVPQQFWVEAFFIAAFLVTYCLLQYCPRIRVLMKLCMRSHRSIHH